MNAPEGLGLAPAAGGRVHAPYQLRWVTSREDLRAAQALRFEVFNMELDEGLPQSYDSGLDADPFDDVCSHLIVVDAVAASVVGTYRMQTGARARERLGYYSEREFDFHPLEPMRGQILELGRACIHRDHRNFAVLNLLWKGIAAHARECGARYLVGCSSITSRTPADGAAAYRELSGHLAPLAWRTRPTAAFECSPGSPSSPAPRIPRLLSGYLALGACICGPPAIDREFGTIDFLTWLDLDCPTLLAVQRRGRFTA
jgi:putative hemolysin